MKRGARKLESIELVVFDWDGTLMDSAGQIVASMQAAIAALGLPERTDAAIADLIGLGLEDAMTRLFPDIAFAEVNRMMGEYRSSYSGVSAVQSAFFPGVSDELQALSGAGYRLAVATGKSRRGLDAALAATQSGDFFELTRAADETASKPDPRMLLEILAQTGVPESRVLMVGDTEYDVEMAVRAGVHAIGVDCGVHHPERLRDAGAIEVLDAVPGLRRWLDQSLQGRG